MRARGNQFARKGCHRVRQDDGLGAESQLHLMLMNLDRASHDVLHKGPPCGTGCGFEQVEEQLVGGFVGSVSRSARWFFSSS